MSSGASAGSFLVNLLVLVVVVGVVWPAMRLLRRRISRDRRARWAREDAAYRAQVEGTDGGDRDGPGPEAD